MVNTWGGSTNTRSGCAIGGAKYSQVDLLLSYLIYCSFHLINNCTHLPYVCVCWQTAGFVKGITNNKPIVGLAFCVEFPESIIHVVAGLNLLHNIS